MGFTDSEFLNVVVNIFPNVQFCYTVSQFIIYIQALITANEVTVNSCSLANNFIYSDTNIQVATSV